MVESGTHRSLLRQNGVYASLYQEQFEGGKVQWQCTGGDIMADGSIRHRQTQPSISSIDVDRPGAGLVCGCIAGNADSGP